MEALARAAASLQDAAVFATAAFAGLRLGELRALRWRDIDFGKRLVHVRRSYVERAEGAPKSGRVRSVPMSDQVWLRSTASAGGITSPATRTWCSAMRRRPLRRLGSAAPLLHGARPRRLEAIRFHDLRHTFGTLAVQAFPLSDVKAYMGHADIATTMIYVHHVPQFDAAERLTSVPRGGSTVDSGRRGQGGTSDGIPGRCGRLARDRDGREQ